MNSFTCLTQAARITSRSIKPRAFSLPLCILRRTLFNRPNSLEPSKKKPKMPLLLLDFDGTITCTDTLHALICLSIARTTSASPHSDQCQQTTSPLLPDCMSELKTTSQKRPNTAALFSLWDDIVREYVAAHTAHSAQYRPREEDRREIDDEFDYLESVKPIEKASVARVGAAGFFAGLVSWEEAKYESVEGVETRKWGLRDLGRSAVLHSKDTNVPPDGGGELCVEVRKGFGEFMKRFGGTNTDDWEVAVVSVNWSAEFIRGVVEGSIGLERGAFKNRVIANEVSLPSGEVKGPAELGGDVLVSVKDKLRAMKSVMKLDGKERVVYFGDSTTDLACLLAADLGVVVADNTETKLMKTLRRMRFKVPHVGERADRGKLFWARDFSEVIESKILERTGVLQGSPHGSDGASS
jgi:hypothetical protein